LTSPAAALTTRGGLTFDQNSTDNAVPEIITDGVGLRQVLAPQCFVDLLDTPSSPDYEIRLYWPENSGSKSGGIYVPTGSPFKVWRISILVGGNTQFKITEDPAGVNVVNTFTWSSSDNGWTFNQNGLTQERKIVQNGLPPVAP